MTPGGRRLFPALHLLPSPAWDSNSVCGRSGLPLISSARVWPLRGPSLPLPGAGRVIYFSAAAGMIQSPTSCGRGGRTRLISPWSCCCGGGGGSGNGWGWWWEVQGSNREEHGSPVFLQLPALPSSLAPRSLNPQPSGEDFSGAMHF